MSTKLFAVLLALALASSPMPTHHSEYASIVQEINNSDATWTASTEFVESLTEE